MKNLVVILLFLVASTSAYAGTFSCVGVPKEIAVWKTQGHVAVKLENYNKTWLICQIDASPGCKGVLSLLLSAKATQSEVSLVVRDTTYSGCTALPQYTSFSADFDYLIQK